MKRRGISDLLAVIILAVIAVAVTIYVSPWIFRMASPGVSIKDIRAQGFSDPATSTSIISVEVTPSDDGTFYAELLNGTRIGTPVQVAGGIKTHVDFTMPSYVQPGSKVTVRFVLQNPAGDTDTATIDVSFQQVKG